MNKWTLECNGVRKSFEEWGVGSLKRVRVNQGKDLVNFQSQGPELVDEQVVTIYNKDNKVWFRGLITRSPSDADALKESVNYEVSGPWWHLENLVYQQDWWQKLSSEDEAPLAPVSTGRVVLGQDGHGKRINSGAQLREVLEYAMKQGAPFEVGVIDVDVPIPFDETKDLSCAEAIQRLLRWSPDAVVYFDYGVSELPQINIKRRSSLGEITIDLEKSGNVKSLKIAPRKDLQSSAVVLKYEKEHKGGEGSWSTTEIDAYPKEATGREFKALVLTIELEGSKTQQVQQRVKVESIMPDSPQWWQRHMPSLQGIASSGIQVREVRRESDLPMELIEGSIAPWMNQEVKSDVVRAKLSYKTENETVIDREVSVRLQATDAQSRLYGQVLSMGQSEETPEGLAKALYEAVSVLQYDGNIVLEGEEVDYTDWVGKVINIEKGSASWSSMEAMVQRVREDVDKGRTTIEFGPPKHLGADDLVELLRINRRRVAPKKAWLRSSGGSASGTLVQSTHHRIENTDTGSGQYGRMVFIGGAKKKIIVDAEAIKESMTVEFCEEDVCENGVLKKRMVLASAPYKEGEK